MTGLWAGLWTVLWVVLALMAAGALWILLPHALRRRAERRLEARARAARAIVLSYDDGPGERLTPRLLDLFAAEGVGASFFVLGRNAARRPETVARALAEGHEIGSHTDDHAHAWKAPPWTWARDAAAGVARVEALGGDGRLFRPPYGKRTLAGLIQGLIADHRPAWWTVDSRDAWARRPIAEVVAEVEARGGGVVLMHDFDAYGPPPADTVSVSDTVSGDVSAVSHEEHCLALTRALIGLARTGDYRIMRLGDLTGDLTGGPMAG